MTLRASLVVPLLAAALSVLGVDRARFISGCGKATPITTPRARFSDCTMTAQADSGILIGFVISNTYEWGLVLADDSRSFEAGDDGGGRAARSIDRDPIPAIAKVIDVHGIVIPLQNSDPVLEALREGKVLTIVAKAAKISFKLTGTKEAIAELAACVTEHLNSEKVDASVARASVRRRKFLSGGRTASRCRRA